MTTLSPTATSSPRDSAGVQEASPRQVQQWLSTGQAVLIDVREPDEHARERIDGARLVPLSRFDPAHAAAYAKPGQRIVMHCRGGRRSADAARMAASLTASGFVIMSMAGGIEAWKKDNLPVIVDTSVSSISVMRQVQLVIGMCVLGGCALSWFVDPAFIGIPAFFGAGLTFAGASGTCAMASLIGLMPWNRAAKTNCSTPSSDGSCGSGQCG